MVLRVYRMFQDDICILFRVKGEERFHCGNIQVAVITNFGYIKRYNNHPYPCKPAVVLFFTYFKEDKGDNSCQANELYKPVGGGIANIYKSCGDQSCFADIFYKIQYDQRDKSAKHYNGESFQSSHTCKYERP